MYIERDTRHIGKTIIIVELGLLCVIHQLRLGWSSKWFMGRNMLYWWLLDKTSVLSMGDLQDPKMEVLYHIRPCFMGIFTYIGLKNRPLMLVWRRVLEKSMVAPWPSYRLIKTELKKLLFQVQELLNRWIVNDGLINVSQLFIEDGNSQDLEGPPIARVGRNWKFRSSLGGMKSSEMPRIEKKRGESQGLVTVTFWVYWTSPYSSHGIDHIPIMVGWCDPWGHLMTHESHRHKISRGC